MKFSYFTKTTSDNTIFFKNDDPIENVKRIRFYADNSKGLFSKKEFRWSFDKKYWSSWDNLDQGNLSNISIRNNKYLFLEFRYVLISSDSGTISSINIDYEKTTVTTSTL